MKIFILSAMLSSAVAAPPPEPARQQALRNLLKHDCGACHGLTLKGGLGPGLRPADLADKSNEFLTATILRGRPGTAMPPWNRFIDKSEAAWLVEILKNPQP
ncbi:MAG: cytochrome C55X precursor NirC [Gammaproteobacteria bacterium HGW-Gammaproteobacteria-3]|nr:MAG: cytochrome C55X precursor NirC [Gammaproteobacteria bacterium HGW-Gammaproteobacteria-3]